MIQFVDFLRDYWFQLLTFLCFVCEVIFIFIKRKPKSIDDYILALDEVRIKLVELVSMVEEPGHGELKKNKVLTYAQRLFEKKLNRSLTSKELENFAKVISIDIESILNTPTKKEKIDEK